MCGITGVVWGCADSVVESPMLGRMIAALHHRGPDDKGHYRDARAAISHARLSIIDLSTGRQPLSNEDDSIWVAFNGEIYDFAALRADLISRGHHFRTATDTEVIVHLYEERGERCFEALRGMFAIAIWDAPRKRLILARDRLGKKPLVYTQIGDRLAFASEIKALLEIPELDRDIDSVALDQYLALGYIPHPRTIYRHIRKLPPAHYLVFQDNRLELNRYWSLPDADQQPYSEDDYCEQLRETLTEATRLRMVSDVPLGAFLSGGVDSTIVVGLMQQCSDRPVKTFSIGFADQEYDERPYARESAAHLGTEHHEFVVKYDCLDVLPKLVWHFDEPFADSSAIPTYYVAKMTRQHVTVALTGDGADEVFGGYDRYRVLRTAGRS